MGQLISQDQVDRFRQEGYVVLSGFYDPERELVPIQRSLHALIGLLIADNYLPIARAPFSPETFDDGYQALIAHDRKLGGTIYDAAKQIPAFVRLAAHEKHEHVISTLRGSSLIGTANASNGVRIDNPREEKYNTLWHQDYPFHLRSADGVVFWAPLVPVTAEMGPLVVCPRSHRLGPLRLRRDPPGSTFDARDYTLLSKSFVIAEIDEVVSRFPPVEVAVNVGDVLAFDFHLVHKSGTNNGQRSRWSMQMRMFNFLEPTGRRHHWPGSVTSGRSFLDIHPDLVDRD